MFCYSVYLIRAVPLLFDAIMEVEYERVDRSQHCLDFSLAPHIKRACGRRGYVRVCELGMLA